MYVCVWERESVWECVCVCDLERESVCMRGRERENNAFLRSWGDLWQYKKNHYILCDVSKQGCYGLRECNSTLMTRYYTVYFNVSLFTYFNKLKLIKLGYGALFSGTSQFLNLPKLSQMKTLASKVVQRDSKLIN